MDASHPSSADPIPPTPGTGQNYTTEARAAAEEAKAAVASIQDIVVGKKDGTGEIFNDYANNQATGNYATAVGSWTKATAKCAYAEGFNTKAQGETSHAQNEKTIASGRSSHAGGNASQATGDYSFAHGIRAQATAKNSFALGADVLAAGEHSAAIGNETRALSNQSLAIGYGSLTTGNRSFAGGARTVAEGRDSFAFGLGEGVGMTLSVMTINKKQRKVTTSASLDEQPYWKVGDYLLFADQDESIVFITPIESKHAINSYTVAHDFPSEYQGLGTVRLYKPTIAKADESFAFGTGVQATAKNQAVFGTHNAVDDSASFIIGNGQAGAQKNAFSVMKDGSVKIGATVLTEEQLQKLLALLDA